jgi:hypothetical protein
LTQRKLGFAVGAPTLGALGNLVLLDADGDGRCASPEDTVIRYFSGFAVDVEEGLTTIERRW